MNIFHSCLEFLCLTIWFWIEEMIMLMNRGNSDAIYAAWEEKRITWYGNSNDLEVIGGKSWIIKRNQESNNIITSLAGYLLLLKPSQIRKKSLFSGTTDAFVIKDPIGLVAIHNETELKGVIKLFKDTIN